MVIYFARINSWRCWNGTIIIICYYWNNIKYLRFGNNYNFQEYDVINADKNPLDKRVSIKINSNHVISLPWKNERNKKIKWTSKIGRCQNSKTKNEITGKKTPGTVTKLYMNIYKHI